MKLIIIPFFSLIMSMGDPMFMPTPKQPGLIPELQSTSSNINKMKRSPEERKVIKQQQEERVDELYPEQQLMEPKPKDETKLK
jgi:hypothetical protein